MACVAEPARVCRSAGFVDVRTLCALAFPEKKKLRKTGLAVTVASVLGAYVDKTEQCSDWARRPLTQSQTAYAAADAHVSCFPSPSFRAACTSDGEFAEAACRMNHFAVSSGVLSSPMISHENCHR